MISSKKIAVVAKKRHGQTGRRFHGIIIRDYDCHLRLFHMLSYALLPFAAEIFRELPRFYTIYVGGDFSCSRFLATGARARSMISGVACLDAGLCRSYTGADYGAILI